MSKIINLELKPQDEKLFEIWKNNIDFFYKNLRLSGYPTKSQVKVQNPRGFVFPQIFNNDIFLKIPFHPERSEKAFDKLGYNIKLPSKEIKGVLIDVYGGNPKLVNLSDFPIFGNFLPMHYRLMGDDRGEGIAVIILNTVDWLKLQVLQAKMPEQLHDELHDSIHEFMQVLRNNPETIDPSLAKIKGLKIAIMGASFGGRTALKHAELYKDDVDCVISFDGIINFESGEQCYCVSHLRPKSEKIHVPLLIIQNVEDKCVKAKTAVDAYRDYSKYTKTSLFINDRGQSEITTSSSVNFIDYKSRCNNDISKFMEHFYPEDDEAMVEQIFNFITNGPSNINALHQLRAINLEKYTVNDFITYTQNSYIANAGEVVTAEDMSNWYKDHQITINKDFVTECFLSEAYKLYNKHTVDMNKNDQAKWLSNNKELMKNLFYAQAYRLENIENLKDTTIITDERIKKAIEISFNEFFEITKNLYKLIAPGQEVNFDNLSNQQLFVDHYRQFLENNNLNFIYEFAVANLEIFEHSVFTPFKQQWELQCEEKLRDLEKFIEQKNNIVKNIWQQMYEKVKTTEEYKINLENTKQKKLQKTIDYSESKEFDLSPLNQEDLGYREPKEHDHQITDDNDQLSSPIGVTAENNEHC